MELPIQHSMNIRYGETQQILTETTKRYHHQLNDSLVATCCGSGGWEYHVFLPRCCRQLRLTMFKLTCPACPPYVHSSLLTYSMLIFLYTQWWSKVIDAFRMAFQHLILPKAD